VGVIWFHLLRVPLANRVAVRCVLRLPVTAKAVASLPDLILQEGGDTFF
jgi:hypothetical protein